MFQPKSKRAPYWVIRLPQRLAQRLAQIDEIESMSISTAIAIAALPAIQLASKAVQGAFETSANFASHLAGPAPTKTEELASPDKSEQNHSELDQLVTQFQEFLRSIDTKDRSTIELKGDGQQPIEVDGEPSIREAVQSWLDQNPEWTIAWQSAVKKYLAESPSTISSANAPFSGATQPLRLRSQISSSTAEHWQSV